MRSVLAAASAEEKFWRNICPEPNTGCWIWLGHLTEDLKYGRFVNGKKRWMAHHFSYALYVGIVPEGKEIHHKCNLGWCVNPLHLEPVHKLENTAIRNAGTLPVIRTWAESRRSVSEQDKFSKFIAKKDTGCWDWLGGTNGKYGVYTPKRGQFGYAHRFSYEKYVGPIPDGLDIDHLCRNTLCVNPDHLEPVTRSENIKRKHSRVHGNKCRRGHEFSEENTWYEKSGARHCRKCHAFLESQRRSQRRRKHDFD